MCYKPFPTSVRIRSSSNSYVVATAWEALEYLKAWPAKRTRAYGLALQRCLDAVDGLCSPKTAQRSFRMAVREAGLLA